MSIIDLPATTLAPVTHDLYRDIHKAIRTELFAVTMEAASLDPSQGLSRAALAAHVREVVAFLVDHAEHEDAAIQPVLERELPDLAARVEVDHETLEARMDDLVEMAEEAAQLDAVDAGHRIHRVHLAFASFTGAYLEHQDVEEQAHPRGLGQDGEPPPATGMGLAVGQHGPEDQRAPALQERLPVVVEHPCLPPRPGVRAS